MNIHSEFLKLKSRNENPYTREIIQTKNITKLNESKTTPINTANNFNSSYISCDSGGCRIVNRAPDTYKRPERRGFGGRNRQSGTGMSTIRMGGCSACGGGR